MNEEARLNLRRCDSLDFLVSRKLLSISIQGSDAPDVTLKLNGPELFEIKLADARFAWVSPEHLDRIAGRRITEVKAWVNMPDSEFPGLMLHWMSITADNGKLVRLAGRTFDPIDTPFAPQVAKINLKDTPKLEAVA